MRIFWCSIAKGSPPFLSESCYSRISATTPAPTVRPPSRRQNRPRRLELPVRSDRTRLRQPLTPLHLVLLRPPKQHADVVPRLTLVQQLPEHLHARGDRLLRRTNPQNLHLVPHLDHPALHTARHHRPATRNRKHVLHRHQKRLVPAPNPTRQERTHHGSRG